MHFGYNCKNYLPWFEKCKLMIQNNRNQEDLQEMKWLSIREALIYSSQLNMDLMSLIKKKKIKVKREDKKQIRLGFRAAWKYDECPLVHSGGQCLYFEKHNRKSIKCLSDLETLTESHPNSRKIPNEEDIKAFKNELSAVGKKTVNESGLLFQ